MTFNPNWILVFIALLPAGIAGWYLWLQFTRGTELTQSISPKGWIVVKETPLSRRDHPIKFWASAVAWVLMLAGCVYLAIFVAIPLATSG